MPNNEPGRRPRLISAKPALTTYYQGTSKTDSPFKKKEPTKPWRTKLTKAFDVLIFTVVLLCFFYSLLVNPNPKVIVSSTIYHSNSVYQQAAAQSMNSIRDHSKLSFDESSVVSNLQKKFPEIADASIELPLFGQKPIVRLKIADPSYIFKGQSASYVLASNGVIIASNLKSPNIAKLPIVIDQSGYKVAEGQAALSSSQVDFINQITIQLKHAKVSIKSIVLPHAVQELDVYTNDQPYFVKFYLGGNALIETGQMLAARSQFAKTNQPPSQYLDVRVAGKIFYK